jgi:hypothetical protein
VRSEPRCIIKGRRARPLNWRYMSRSIRHDDIVLAALIYRRNVGADLDSIRTFAFIREAKKQTSKDDKAAYSSRGRFGW